MRRTVFHKNGTVSYWDVFLQQWRRSSVVALAKNGQVMSSLPTKDRERISRMAEAMREEEES